MRIKFIVLFCVCLLVSAGVWARDFNVLVVSSTRPFAQQKGAAMLTKTKVTATVKRALQNDLRVRGKIVITFEDIHRTKKGQTAYGGRGGLMPTEFHCYSLAQWYFWPDGRQERLKSLKGEGETKWNAVVLVGDPYVIKNMPGMYAEGVNLIASAVQKGKAKLALLIPFSDDDAAEVVNRTGMSAGVQVVPYSLAKRVKRKCVGTYEVANPFQMKYVPKRVVTFNHTGSSSENGIQRALVAAMKRCSVQGIKKRPDNDARTKIDFNYGRANSNFEKNKQYKVAPNLFERSYGFPMQDHSKSAAETMLYGIDKRYFNGRAYEDGTDLGIAWDMIRQDEIKHDIRNIPIRLMWAKMQEADPTMKPLGDGWHMSGHLLQACGVYIYTLLSGRCPVSEKPAKENVRGYRDWLGQSIGYETAWRMSHLTARVPGLMVKPLTMNETLKPKDSDMISVKLHYKPTKNVVVSIAPDKKKVLAVKPSTLTFTPENYAKTQTVTVMARTVEEDSAANVKFVTKSEDDVFNKLADSWSYKVPAPPEEKAGK